MADRQLGNVLGVMDKTTTQSTVLANVDQDNATANVVDVDDATKLFVGQVVDIVTIADGTEVAVDRTITQIKDNAGQIEVTYDGADVAPAAGDALYPVDGYGKTVQEGFTDPDLLTIGQMRRRLKVIDSTFYTDAKLNSMTFNDLVYAIRVADHNGTI